jgi:hypothetical protein
LKDANEADDENYDRADMLDYDCGICNEGPEVIGLKARIALEVL